MVAYLPKPYPDELLYSIIARYLNHLGIRQSAKKVLMSMFGRAIGSRTDLPSSLERFAEQTYGLLGATGEEVAHRYTLLPYYTHYQSEAKVKEAIGRIISDIGTGLHTSLGINASRVQQPKYLRYCQRCAIEDMNAFGETYWRRTHQLPGVLVCALHHEVLKNSNVSYRPKHFCEFVDATSCVSFGPSNQALPDDLRCDRLVDIASRSQRILQSSSVDNEFYQGRMNRYRIAALQAGYWNGHGRLALASIEKALCKFYGSDLLACIGCSVTMNSDSNWVRSMFRFHRRPFHPLQHILIQAFLNEASLLSKPSHPFGSGPWRCPNQLAVHGEEKPIKTISLSNSKKGYVVASAKCVCGFHFSFRSLDEVDKTLPRIHTIQKFGRFWELQAHQLRDQGVSIRAIAKQLGIDSKSVNRLLGLSSPASSLSVSKHDIESWRSEWTTLLKNVPEQSVTAARAVNKALYARLRRHDYAWIYSNSRKAQSGRNVMNNRVDWEQRDILWAKCLGVAAKKLRSSSSLARLTRTRIIHESMDIGDVLHNIQKLPMCELVLCENEESLEEYRERRWEKILREMGGNTKSVPMWKLLKRAGLLHLAPEQRSKMTGRIRNSCR